MKKRFYYVEFNDCFGKRRRKLFLTNKDEEGIKGNFELADTKNPDFIIIRLC